MNKPKFLLLDWDLTLIDLTHFTKNCAKKLLEKHPQAKELLAKQATFRSARDMFKEFFGDTWQTALSEFNSLYNDDRFAELKIISGAKELLQTATEQNVKMAVVSNKQKKNLQAEIDFLDWGKYFEVIVGSGDTQNDKPNPEPVNFAISQLAAKYELSLEAVKQDAIFVGDSSADLEAATAANVKCFIVGDKIKLIDITNMLKSSEGK